MAQGESVLVTKLDAAVIGDREFTLLLEQVNTESDHVNEDLTALGAH